MDFHWERFWPSWGNRDAVFFSHGKALLYIQIYGLWFHSIIACTMKSIFPLKNNYEIFPLRRNFFLSFFFHSFDEDLMTGNSSGRYNYEHRSSLIIRRTPARTWNNYFDHLERKLWNKRSNKFGSHDQAAIEYKTKSQQKQKLDKQTTKRARWPEQQSKRMINDAVNQSLIKE